jgi:hypothetical protein
MITDRTNHNRLADQMAARLREEFIAVRTAELATFEKKVSGETPPRKPKRNNPSRTAPAASVAQQEQATTMSNVSSFSLFQNATPTSAYLKCGIMGKQGAGKSRTAAEIAVGLVKHLKELGVSYATKPAAFFDTETGSDWLIPLFEKAGIPLVVAKKRSFADLLAAVRWAEENASVLIIDSITHPWRELLESYMKKKQRSFLQIDDWGYLKGDHGWAQFTDLYINSKLHIVMCGRAGDDTEQYTDENGKRQFEKVGVKMKTEGETGFEPSLLILMEREMDLRTKDMAHVAKVLKDRSDLLDGKEFVNPTFADFLPHINRLNLGGTHVGVNLNGDSQHILKVEKKDWTPVQREICIDEIQTLLALHYPSQSAEDKKNKLKALLAHFDATWTEIEKVMPLPDLRAGYDSLLQALEGKPSKYAASPAKTNEINDGIPEFLDRRLAPSPELLASKIVAGGTTTTLSAATAAVLNDASPDFAAAAG